tara:strand:+ start:33 stop:281 length:249 start_codon:yes stop_codon:yes gene_type:complete
MSGIFSSPKAPNVTVQQSDASSSAAAAMARSEERADSQEMSERKGVQKRRRLRRTGGLRLLFSPARMEGPDQATTNKLGGGQ